MRLVLAIAALAFLGACNMVVTQAPVFEKADEAGAPRLREGVWASAPDDSNCHFDEKAPVKSWPSCANGGVFGVDTISAYTVGGDKRDWITAHYVLAVGAPRVLQIYFSSDALGGGSAPARAIYVYGDLNPVKFDGEGRITAFQMWPVFCGPPPQTEGSPGNDIRLGTRKPLPGLTVDQQGVNCATTSKGAVRNAAAASRTWFHDISTTHWVRDGE